MSSADVFCAALIARRYLPRKTDLAREVLLDPDRMADVRRHLSQVGLRLVDSVYSDHLGVALLDKNEAGESIVEVVFGADEPQPFITSDLQRDELALAMLLWTLLCLPKRQPEDAKEGESTPAPRILISTLLADYPQLGAPRRIRKNLTRLRHLQLVDYGLDEFVVEGPLLEVLFDGEGIAGRVTDKSFRETLAKLRTALPQAGAQGDLPIGSTMAPAEGGENGENGEEEGDDVLG